MTNRAAPGLRTLSFATFLADATAAIRLYIQMELYEMLWADFRDALDDPEWLGDVGIYILARPVVAQRGISYTLRFFAGVIFFACVCAAGASGMVLVHDDEVDQDRD